MSQACTCRQLTVGDARLLAGSTQDSCNLLSLSRLSRSLARGPPGRDAGQLDRELDNLRGSGLLGAALDNSTIHSMTKRDAGHLAGRVQRGSFKRDAGQLKRELDNLRAYGQLSAALDNLQNLTT